MKVAILKNGSKEASSLVTVTMMNLRKLIESEPIAFFELVSMARDSTHKPFGNTNEVLQRFGLLDTNNCMHDSIKNIILSASTGGGLDMMLDNPIVSEKEEE